MLVANRGFTLIELIITVTVLSVMLAIAIPNFRDFVRRNRLTTQSNEFVTAINLTRAEAIRRNRNVSLRANDPSDSNNEWGKGWRVTDLLAVPTTLRVAPVLPGTLTFNGPTGVNAVVFNPNGLLNAGAGTYRLCDPEKSGQQITLSATGQTSHVKVVCP